MIEGTAFRAQAPAAVLLLTGALHHHRLVQGGGWSFHVNVRPDYVESLLELPNEPLRGARVEEVCRTAEPHSGTVRAWEEQDGAFEPGTVGSAAPVLWKFISPREFRDPGVRLQAHQFLAGAAGGFREAAHRHATDEAYLFLPAPGHSLEVEVMADGRATRTTAPMAAYHRAGSRHGYRHVAGSGLVLKLLKL